MATKMELYEAIADWENDPDGLEVCDNLCWVCDQLPGQPDGEFSPDELREMVRGSDLPD